MSALDDALTVHVVGAGHILGLASTAVDAHVVVVRDTGAQHFVLPVGVAALVVGVARDVVVPQEATDVVGRSHVERLSHLVDGHIAVVAHVGAAFQSALGGDDDHTVGSLRTIDGRSRSVAQHVDGLNIIGSHHRDVYAGNTVDDVVGLHGSTFTQRRDTAQGDAGRTVGVAVGGDAQTGHLALQHRGGICKHTLVEVLGLHGGDRAGDVLTAHGAVTYYYNLVEQLVVFLHGDAHAFACTYRLAVVADVRDFQVRALGNAEGELTVDVGRGAVGCSGLFHAHADEGLALRIGDSAGDALLCPCDGGHHQEQGERQHAAEVLFYVSHKCFFKG